MSAEGVDVGLVAGGAAADAADVVDSGLVDSDPGELGDRAGDALLVGEGDQSGADRDPVGLREPDVRQRAVMRSARAADDLGVFGGVV